MLRSICAASSFWLGDLSFRYAGASADAPAYHFYREDFCSNRSVMLRRLMPRCLWPPRQFQTVRKSPPFPLSPSSQILPWGCGRYCRGKQTTPFSSYSPSTSPSASTALRTHSGQGHSGAPVSTPFRSLQMVAPHFS